MSTQKPFGLADAELQLIKAAAQPLQPHQRAPFLAAVVEAFVAEPERGVGVLHRICARTQRQFFDPPDLSRDASKYR
jgi:hypothetical protein